MSDPGASLPRVRLVPHGVLAYVPLTGDRAALDGELAPEELAHARTLASRRAPTWVGGRVALRRALAEAGANEVPAILATDRGGPAVPPGFRGSISHKDTLAVALAARDDGAGLHLGVDLELDVPRRAGIERHVLTETERAHMSSPSDVLVAFTLKEAIYKAIDPFVRRYVGFQEVELRIEGSRATVLTRRLRNGEGPFRIEVWWVREDGMLIATARAVRADGQPE